VVLDEADKMLSLGLEPQLERLRALLLPAGGDPAAAAGAPPRRPQVQLWTATMPAALRAATARWLQRPRRLRAAAGADAIGRSVVQARPAPAGALRPPIAEWRFRKKGRRWLGCAQRPAGPAPRRGRARRRRCTCARSTRSRPSC